MLKLRPVTINSPFSFTLEYISKIFIITNTKMFKTLKAKKSIPTELKESTNHYLNTADNKKKSKLNINKISSVFIKKIQYSAAKAKSKFVLNSFRLKNHKEPIKILIEKIDSTSNESVTTHNNDLELTFIEKDDSMIVPTEKSSYSWRWLSDYLNTTQPGHQIDVSFI
jgi:soluble cytochrome b562